MQRDDGDSKRKEEKMKEFVGEVKHAIRAIEIVIWAVWYILSGQLTLAIFRCRGTTNSITFWGFVLQKIVGVNRFANWPVAVSSVVNSPNKIKIGVNCAPGSSIGCYIQASGGIEFGDYVRVGPGAKIVSSNHDVYNIYDGIAKKAPVKIGKYSWLGANSVVLPGVILGDHTIVAAGAVVTKSFPEGNAILAGIPAKVVKVLDPGKIIEGRHKYAYRGFKRVY